MQCARERRAHAVQCRVRASAARMPCMQRPHTKLVCATARSLALHLPARKVMGLRVQYTRSKKSKILSK